MEYQQYISYLIWSIISGFFGKYIGDRNQRLLQVYLFQFQQLLSLFIFYKYCK